MEPRRKSLLERIFHAGITLKGLGGVTEMVGGIMLWFIKPASMSRMVQFLFLEELARNPDGFFTSHVLRESMKFANADPTFASLYLFSHGITKVILVVCLWLNKLWAYPLTILVFAGFCAYQIHRYTRTHSVTLILLTIFDLILIYLTWREYLEQKQILEEQNKK
ncbi:MAG: DUF2127 domain-containing protein [Candidatus Acidiferrales bacterium]